MAREARPIGIRRSKGKVTITFNDEGWSEFDTKLVERIGDVELGEQKPATAISQALQLYCLHRFTPEYNKIIKHDIEYALSLKQELDEAEKPFDPNP